MNKDEISQKKKVHIFSYLKKSKNEINDFYSEWERFQKIRKIRIFRKKSNLILFPFFWKNWPQNPRGV